MQKERTLEEFRSLRFSNDEKRRNKEVTKEKKLKLRIVLYVIKKTQVRNKATNL